MSPNEKEIEAKFYVLDLDRIKSRLQTLEAHLIQERVLETNIRFDLPDGGLSSEGRVLRLRQDTDARLTYKGPGTSKGGVLSRTEIEFVLEDFDKARLFLEALGYQRSFYYEKYRTTYELQVSEATTHIMLDELPYGNFVEIEGGNVKLVQEAAKRLNLNMKNAIPSSYHVLFTHFCTHYPTLDLKELSFKALQGMKISPEELSIQAAD